MLGYLKPLGCILCASVLGLFCSQDGSFFEDLTEILQMGNYESKMNQLEKQMTELHEKDLVILNRLSLKKEIVNALYRGDITVEQATSCFHHIMEHGNIKYEITIPGHEGLPLKVRAGLCLMLWIDDPDCPNLRKVWKPQKQQKPILFYRFLRWIFWLIIFTKRFDFSLLA